MALALQISVEKTGVENFDLKVNLKAYPCNTFTWLLTFC